ncbi:MAG: hypothetical protein IH621_08580 [Krumholzibacteria bacterium]|nr:hypothetical protein [Candidatus Krumholzibacteria bacterium]
MKLRIILAGGACVALLAFAACDDDCPTCPDTALSPTMANIWPHADGNAWTYEGTYAEYPLDPDLLMGPLPALADLRDALLAPPAGVPGDSAAGMYRLALDGQVLTESGVQAQRVTQTFYLAWPALKAQRPVDAGGGGDRLLHLIVRGRPDLRAALADRLGPAAKELTNIVAPFFLGGYAFAYEDSGYFGYGDLDTAHSWVYLEDSLAVGTEFSLRLVPMLADDIWLHGRIWSRGDRSVGGRTYRNVVECMYLVDLGEQWGTDEDGDPTGPYRAYFTALTWYAPGVGPISGRERHLLARDDSVQGPQASLVIDYVMDLVGATQAD